MSRGRFVHILCLTCLGCAPIEPAPTAPARPAPPLPAPAASSPPAVAQAAPARLPIQFEPAIAGFEGAPVHLEIQAPIAGKRIAQDQVSRTPMRFKAENWSEVLSLVLLLDNFPPRSFEDPSQAKYVSQLIPENRELEVGLHWLFASVQGSDGTTLHVEKPESRAPFAMVPFWVGTEVGAAEVPHGPHVVLVSPRGTFNGESAADNVLLDFHVLGVGEGIRPSVKVEVLAQSQIYEKLLTSERLLRIRGLPSGDHLVKVSLLSADGTLLPGPHATAARTITINRDAPVE